MKKILLFKMFIILLVIILIGFLLFQNFQPTGAVVLDVKESDSLELTPKERVVEINSVTELVNNLVYFNSIVPQRTKEAKVRVWFKDNFPELSTFSIGARNKKEWSYKYKKVFEKTYDNAYTPENLPEIAFGSLVYNPFKLALDRESKLKLNESNIVIKNALRGGHIIYTYLNKSLVFEIEKKDINWYDNEDELKVKLYKNNDLLNAVVIRDDGITTVNKTMQKLQEGILTYENIQEGVYRIELDNNADMIIPKIKTNTNKIVFTKLYLADNPIYNIQKNNITIYSYLSDGILKFLTYHNAGFQKIKIDNTEFNLDEKNKTIILKLDKGFHRIYLEKGDVIISGNEGSYFTFSENNYFHPYLFYETKDPKMADYIILDKLPKNDVEDDGDWLKAEVVFDLNETYINDKGELSFIFNTPHLGKNETKNYTIPIKKIEIEYYQEPLIELE